MLTKQEILLGKGTQVESRRVRDPRRTALPRGSQSLGFMVTGLVSGWSLSNHSNSESFLVAQHHSAKTDASERDSGKWTDKQCPLLTFPELFWLLVAY